MKNWKCKILGHYWEKVYVGKHGEWKIIAVECRRCGYGHDGLLKFIGKYNHDYGTYNKKYYEEDYKSPKK